MGFQYCSKQSDADMPCMTLQCSLTALSNALNETGAPARAEGSVRVFCGDLKIPANTGIIADICKNTDGITGMRRVLRKTKKRDNYHEARQAHGSGMWLARIGSTNRSQAKHLCSTDTYT